MPCAPGTVWSQEHQTCVHDCDTGYCGNPCTAENIEDGNFYHEHCTEDNKFIQCDNHGGCFVMPCASGTVWSQKHQVCVHECNPYPCDNPCTDDNIEDGHFYHEHCKKDNKFIQCDDFGGCFAMDCADGTVWSQEDLTCVQDGNKKSNSEPYPAPSPSKSRNSEVDSKSKSKSNNSGSHSKSKSESESEPYPVPRDRKSKGKGQGTPKSKWESSLYHSKSLGSDDYYNSASKGKGKGGTESEKSGCKSGGTGKCGYSEDRSGTGSRPGTESRSKEKGKREGSWSKSPKSFR